MICFDLKLFVTLGKFHPAGGNEINLQEGTTVAAMIRKFKIPEEEVKLIFINGKKAGLENVIQDGDRVGLFPPVGGG